MTLAIQVRSIPHMQIPWSSDSLLACEDTIGGFIRDQINGQMFRNDKCDIWAIFDGPNGGRLVATYTSGHGVNCGWVNSGALEHWDWTTFITDYYHDCSW
jgi:hypothetical protein